MKKYFEILIGILIGLLAAGVLYLVASPPRGQPVQLLPPPTPAPLAVYVNGGVKSPGVYQLPKGSRVQDAIDAAGGFSRSADSSRVNLAALIEDGMQLAVPTKTPTLLPLVIGGAAHGSTPPAPASGLIDINTADAALLETLPGIGPTIAQRIVDYRTEHGAFQTIEEIMNVPGIGSSTFDKIKDYITVNP
jgi:competence protein ComEA